MSFMPCAVPHGNQFFSTSEMKRTMLLILLGLLATTCAADTNYALNMSTRNGGTWSNPAQWGSQQATDGLYGQYAGGSAIFNCFVGADGQIMWWAVQLSRWIRIRAVHIYSRNDNSDRGDIGNGHYLGAFDPGSAFNPNRSVLLYTQSSAIYDSPGAVAWFNYTVSATGRYFAIRSPTSAGRVCLCEVEVYGDPNLLYGAGGVQLLTNDPVYQQQMAANQQILTDGDETTCMTLFDAGRSSLARFVFPHSAGSNVTVAVWTNGSVKLDAPSLTCSTSGNLMAVAVGISNSNRYCRLLSQQSSGTQQYWQFLCECTACTGSVSLTLWRQDSSAMPLQVCEVMLFKN